MAPAAVVAIERGIARTEHLRTRGVYEDEPAYCARVQRCVCADIQAARRLTYQDEWAIGSDRTEGGVELSRDGYRVTWTGLRGARAESCSVVRAYARNPRECRLDPLPLPPLPSESGL